MPGENNLLMIELISLQKRSLNKNLLPNPPPFHFISFSAVSREKRHSVRDLEDRLPEVACCQSLIEKN